ncbi:tyrosine-type recombinase/integrase, partial [Candidatus Uhrbacteria bacterium]|nr:tyrosine-type recombinase/integrase [Candidatus Uhrbacteria bacterium]
MHTELAQFERYLRNRYAGRSTAKHYMSDLAIFSDFVKDTPPAAVGVKQIDAFVAAQSAQGLKAATINRRLSAISSFYEFLIGETEDEQLRNPVVWKRHSIRQGRHLPRDVQDTTLAQLFAVIDDSRDRAMFELMLGAGLRVGEVVTLQLSDLHAPDASGLVRLRVRGKGDKERIVWLTAETHRHLQGWLQVRPATEQKHLFLNQRGTALSVAGVQYRLKQYCQQTGVQLTCHQLRHTYARRLVEHGMPIASLAKLLGHNDLQTTQRYIDGADPTVRDDFHQAIRALDQHRQPAPPTPPEVSRTTALPPTQPETRPDPEVLVEKVAHLAAELPQWLQDSIRQHTIRRIAQWSAHRAAAQTHHHFSTLCRIARWLVQERHWQQLDQLRRSDIVAYVNVRQEAGIKPGSIAAELTVFRALWRDLLAQEQVTNGSILSVKAPPAGEHLPRYLTTTEYQRLEQVMQTQTQADTPQDRFNRLWFYLLAHAGLRKSEILNLRLADCDLSGRRLRVQSGKGDRDRILPMTEQLVVAVQDYLVVRETATTDHLLIYKGTAVKSHLIPDRLRRWGQLAGITRLTPHRLRHTLATFLIN